MGWQVARYEFTRLQVARLHRERGNSEEAEEAEVVFMIPDYVVIHFQEQLRGAYFDWECCKSH